MCCVLFWDQPWTFLVAHALFLFYFIKCLFGMISLEIFMLFMHVSIIYLWNVAETEHCFDGKSTTYGFSAMLPLFKLEENDGGFLVNGQVMIVADLDVFEVIGTFDDNAAEPSLMIHSRKPHLWTMPMEQNRYLKIKLKSWRDVCFHGQNWKTDYCLQGSKDWSLIYILAGWKFCKENPPKKKKRWLRTREEIYRDCWVMFLNRPWFGLVWVNHFFFRNNLVWFGLILIWICTA